MKNVIVGVHLRREDIEPLAGALPAGDLFLSAMEVDDDRPLGDRDLLLSVARVRAALLERATFIAVRYGFAAATAHEAAAKVAAQLPRWRETLERNSGCVEMTLKVVASDAQPRPDRRDFSSGAAYLQALHQAVRAAAVDPAFRERAGRLLGSHAVRSVWIPRDERSAELALLVPRQSLEGVRAAGETLRAESPDVPFLLSGPWPLEVFADADHQ